MAASHGVGGRVVAVLLVLLAAGCSGAQDQQADAGAAAGSPGVVDEPADQPADAAPEKSEITLGLLPLIDVAPVYIALEDGLFEREGLKVDIQPVQGGAASIPAMIAGELDIAFGAYPSTLSGYANGLDVRIIAEGNRAAEGFTNFVALPDSGLEGDPAALEGKRLALNTFANTAELSARSVIEAAGADYGEVDAVEVPFPEMVPTLQRGEVDAIFAVEPFDTIATQALGAVVVSDAYTGETEGLPVGGYSVTGNFATNFPNTVAAFQRALSAATDIARDDPARVVDVLPTYTTLDADAAGTVTQPEFVARVDSGQIQRIVDLMVQFSFLDEPVDLDQIIVPAPS